MLQHKFDLLLARLFGAAEVLRETIGVREQSGERAAYDRNVAAVRNQLGEAAFAAGWAAGRALSLAQAIAEAVECLHAQHTGQISLYDRSTESAILKHVL